VEAGVHPRLHKESLPQDFQGKDAEDFSEMWPSLLKKAGSYNDLCGRLSSLNDGDKSGTFIDVIEYLEMLDDNWEPILTP
jgi:hypothetical protein